MQMQVNVTSPGGESLSPKSHVCATETVMQTAEQARNICTRLFGSSDRCRPEGRISDCGTPKFRVGLVCERQVGLIEGLNGSDIFPVTVIEVRLHVHADVLCTWDDFAAKIVGLRHSDFSQM